MRLASFNVKNLFLAGDAGIALTRFGARAKRRAELRALARALTRVDADLVALQEVGSLAALCAVNELLTDPYPYLRVVPGNSSRGIALAFASRKPIEVVSHAERVLTDEDRRPLCDYPNAAAAQREEPEALRLQRDLLRCDISCDGIDLSVFNVHLKSPNQPRWCLLSAEQLRAAECRLIAEIVTDFQQLHAQRPVALLGDFNDLWPSAALAALDSAGLIHIDYHGANKAGTFWPAGLTIDHLLANAAMARMVVPDSAVIHDLASLRRGSDHCPVSVDLELSIAQASADRTPSRSS
jgi:endonuclease/exonuclease/phosphatase family metal-dependent hydrolase